MSNSGLTASSDLNDWLRWQETAHSKAWDFGLKRIGEVWRRLGSPRVANKIITVAGTNGKGSCVRWLEALAMTHGVLVASFTSPHLLDYRERIRFDGQWVDGQDLVNAFVAIDAARAEISLSYFEWSALAAFYLMAQRELDLAVLEVGLGGRLDGTNIIDADAVVITKIGLDHTQWLGNTIEEIATEKAAVMRAGQLAVFSDKQPPQALFEYAHELGANVQALGKDFTVRVHNDSFDVSLSPSVSGEQADFTNLPLPQYMHGEHQIEQFAASVCVFTQFYAVERAKLELVLQQTVNPARLMSVTYQHRQWLLDVAHNSDSAQVLATHLQAIQGDVKVPVVCGMLGDKDAKSVFRHLDNHVVHWYLISLHGERGAHESWLAEQAKAAGIANDKITLCGALPQAVQTLMADDTQSTLGVVMGSFVTVTAALNLMNIRV